MRAEVRQPPPLPAQILGPRLHPWQPSTKIVADAEDGIDGPCRSDRPDGPTSQSRELNRDQVANEPEVEVELPVVHLQPPDRWRRVHAGVDASVQDHSGASTPSKAVGRTGSSLPGQMPSNSAISTPMILFRPSIFATS